MKARLFLILIFCTISIVLVTNGSYDLIPSKEIFILNKRLILNTELIISLIVLGTLLGVFFIGVIERLFFTKSDEKQKDD